MSLLFKLPWTISSQKQAKDMWYIQGFYEPPKMPVYTPPTSTEHRGARLVGLIWKFNQQENPTAMSQLELTHLLPCTTLHLPMELLNNPPRPLSNALPPS
eukprot:m.480837 g.480837  ORF g.480837 m.480837 type:complete len:100 (-) comp21711_c1_seq5:2089-2388(-)